MHRIAFGRRASVFLTAHDSTFLIDGWSDGSIGETTVKP